MLRLCARAIKKVSGKRCYTVVGCDKLPPINPKFVQEVRVMILIFV